MFASLKNKIKEETGSDPTKVVASPNLPKSTPGYGELNYKERHSKVGLGTSSESLPNSPTENSRLGSVSPDPPLSSMMGETRKISDANGQVGPMMEDELAKQLQKKEKEWNKLMALKESEWSRSIKLLEKEKAVLEEEKRDLLNQNLVIEDSLKAAEDYKKKIFQYREDIDQLEGFQTQELAKIKHLLLAKEQEVTEMASVIKENSGQIETLQSEVKRLQRFEAELINVQDELEDLRHVSDREKRQLTSKLAGSEEETRHLRDKLAVGKGGEGELELRLEEVHLHLSEVKTSWSEKISTLETQVGRLSRQAGEEGTERRRAESELASTNERLRGLQTLLVEANVSAKRSEDRALRLADEREGLLSEATRLREAHSREVSRLLGQTDEATDKIRHLTVMLVDAEKQAEVSKNECAQLSSELEVSTTALERERSRSSELSLALQRQVAEKDSTLLRNAQLNQDVELIRRELRSHETEAAEVTARLTVLETTVVDKNKELNSLRTENAGLLNRVQSLEATKANEHASCAVEHELRRNITDLEEQLAEKVKAIRVLQQHMGDLKKTLQRELRQGGEDGEGGGGGAAILAPSSNRHVVAPSTHATGHRGNGPDDSEVNFKYLKHVIIKFLTSREYEAQHLTRAVATLLRFSPEEERLLRETLDWKMSWFGTRPRLGFGQTSKTIPPS